MSDPVSKNDPVRKNERVLFELRFVEDETGSRLEVTESAEWRDYHQARRADRRGCGPLAGFTGWQAPDAADHEHRDPRKRPNADNLRRALDSLQSIYDDLYSDASA